jgi:hypothetical protein
MLSPALRLSVSLSTKENRPLTLVKELDESAMAVPFLANQMSTTVPPVFEKHSNAAVNAYTPAAEN